MSAGACYGVYTVSAKRLLADNDPLPVLATTPGLAAVLLLPALPADVGALASWQGVALVAWLGLVTMGAAYLLFVQGLGRVPAATAGTLSLAEPLTASALGVVMLTERPSATAAIGALLLLGGLMLAAALPRRSRATPVARDRRLAEAA